MNLHKAIRWELDILEIEFPGKTYLTIEEYADFYGISRRYASQHLKRRGIPYIKDGRKWRISLVDIARHFAQRKHKGDLLLAPTTPEEQAREMKNRRGFAAAALARQLL